MNRPVDLLRRARTIAVVGLSTDPAKPSARVGAYLQTAGYRVLPVHPTAERLLGMPVYRSLTDIRERVDMVDVFRPAAEAVGLAREAVAIGAKVLWLQSGIVCEEAAAIARAGGLQVVMDHCTMIEHRELARTAAMQLAQ